MNLHQQCKSKGWRVALVFHPPQFDSLIMFISIKNRKGVRVGRGGGEMERIK